MHMHRAIYMFRNNLRRPKALSTVDFEDMGNQEVKAKGEL
jgi:hypothetical protein